MTGERSPIRVELGFWMDIAIFPYRLRDLLKFFVLPVLCTKHVKRIARSIRQKIEILKFSSARTRLA